MRSARGAVMLQVILVTVVATLMCAALLRARFQPALTAASDVDRVANGLEAQAAVNRVTEVWARLGVCGSDPLAGVACAGMGCACNCVVTTDGGGGEERGARSAVGVASSPSGGACALTAASQ
jgi:hypothetical protein